MNELSQAEIERLQKMSLSEQRLKKEGFTRIAGVDEAGRGPLAGPVVAVACILPEETYFENLNDSKQLTPEQREELYSQIIACPDLMYGIGIMDVETIDSVNILQATFLAMRAAIESLEDQPDYALIDGSQIPLLEFPTEFVVGGDAKSISIAVASILAKVTRDRIMIENDAKYPQYGFKSNKGYATDFHMKAIYKFGPCLIHRKTFDPVKSILNPQPVQESLL